MNIENQLSEQIFQSRQAFIKKNVFAYIDIKQKSPCIVICLHQHYGLQNYLRLMAQYITSNHYSILIPSLFKDSENTHQIDDATFLASLDHSKIAQTVYSAVDYAAKSGKAIVLMGFSIGAAIGLKMLQYLTTIDLAFFFYGLPPLDAINANAIVTETKIFLGRRDPIKYLSDVTLVNKAKKAYSANKNIEVIEVENVSHGFMNPVCHQYSQKDFEYYGQMVQERIRKFVKNHNQSITSQENNLSKDLSNGSLQPQARGKAQEKGKQAKNPNEQNNQSKHDKSRQEGCSLI